MRESISSYKNSNVFYRKVYVTLKGEILHKLRMSDAFIIKVLLCSMSCLSDGSSSTVFYISTIKTCTGTER